MKGKKFIILLLSILLAIAILYIGIDKLGELQAEKALGAYQQGVQEGAAQAVLTLLQQSDNCNPTPVFAGNITRTLIDVACLQQAEV